MNSSKQYVIVVQCHITKERCPGYNCERAFHERSHEFAVFSENARMLAITCGGCCGKALQRKLSLFLKKAKKHEAIEKENVTVQLASCITRSNSHGPVCPHLSYIKGLVSRAGLKVREHTLTSDAVTRRWKSQESTAEIAPAG